ncbi:C6 finger domain transcription factor nosA [Penicillium hispanicum]|uniref:C6 finger domain transcription factor nosA n=1 Tax=Penicillium hispanicum TaxID=1080232 RepID=UPI0025424D31|nr:C6 finger domain transcription factor nosA [Penicillium hispanicum]KAJ5579721.1 C6 finger domain transcription factor nosA [Penicillium hispanicum]
MPSTKKTTSAASSSNPSNPSSSSQPSSAQRTSSTSGDKTNAKVHKRSRSGCFTCRLRRKKCDEAHPACGACVNLSVRCEYKRPVWWGNTEQRKAQKERIKNKIKQTKSIERSSTHADIYRNRHQSLSSPTSVSPVYDFNRPMFAESQDVFSSHLPTPGLGTAPYGPYAPSSYEIDVRTERQTFINDVPMRHDSSTSTFSTFAPPQLSAPLPTIGGEDWFGEEYFNQASNVQARNPGLIDPTVDQSHLWLQSNIPVSDLDRPLLDHFIHNVLRQIFPVLEAHQRGHLRAQAILRALEVNKCYLHCCLSVAAIHLKTTEGLAGEQIDHEIMRHRYEAISQLCQALGEDVNHGEILDATLAMIFFHCSVGPSDDYLPDIPWFDHFQAASSLVNRLGLPSQSLESVNGYMVPSFSMGLTSWIDILGSTMVGKTPQFAHTYRSKHLSGTSTGLRELMGCDDRIMYLISEIACLDSLKNEGRIDDFTVCSHVQALGRQLEYTEPADPTLENPYSPSTRSIRPEALTKTMSYMFRTAARIYLCSLVPGFDRSQPTIVNLTSAVTNALQFIPAGPNGFDRSLVWPILMVGVFTAPSSQFRVVLAERAAFLGDHADLGSFGRMYRLLQEVWRLTDNPMDAQGVSNDDYNSSLTSPISRLDRSDSGSPTGAGATLGGREIKRQQVHWRDVMRRNNWHYLLI